jgi:hypothetical protein
MGLLLAVGLLVAVVGVSGATGATTARPTDNRIKGYVATANASVLPTSAPEGSRRRPINAPVARTAVGPLAVPVATFILKGLATGVLSKVGGEAFGKVLSEAGFESQGEKTLNALKVVDAKLEQIKQSLGDLSNKVDGLTASLAFARLSNVRTSLRDLVGRIKDAQARLQQLSSGKITDPTLRKEKRAELLEIIKTKLLTEQNTLNEAIDSAQGNDDIVHTAFQAEHAKGRFWSEHNWDRAAEIVRYYRDEAAELLLLRVEYEYSSVKQDSSPLYVAERQAIAQDMVDKQVAEFSRINSAYPTQMGNYATVVDTKRGPDGKHQVWVNDSRFDDYLFPVAESAPGQYQENYPSLAEFRNLVSGRGSQSTTDYLRSQGFTLPLSCTRNSRQATASVPAGPQVVFWTRDIGGGGRRWAWGEHDDGQGQLLWACGNIRVRDLYPWEHFW